MKRVENDCVGCPTELRHSCIGCSNKNVVRFYCDRCGDEEKLYHYDSEELCESCLLKEFSVVDGSDVWWHQGIGNELWLDIYY